MTICNYNSELSSLNLVTVPFTLTYGRSYCLLHLLFLWTPRLPEAKDPTPMGDLSL